MPRLRPRGQSPKPQRKHVMFWTHDGKCVHFNVGKSKKGSRRR